MCVDDKEDKFADYSLAAHLSNLDCVFVVLTISNSLNSCFFVFFVIGVSFRISPNPGTCSMPETTSRHPGTTSRRPQLHFVVFTILSFFPRLPELQRRSDEGMLALIYILGACYRSVNLIKSERRIGLKKNDFDVNQSVMKIVNVCRGQRG